MTDPTPEEIERVEAWQEKQRVIKSEMELVEYHNLPGNPENPPTSHIIVMGNSVTEYSREALLGILRMERQGKFVGVL